MAAKLLVCSVFCGSDLDKFWLDQQRGNLARTAGEFDHAVYLSHRADPGLFRQCTVVGTSSVGDKAEHLDGLRALSAYAQKKSSYEGYLVLDSDAYPITANWEEILQYYLTRFNKRSAAAIRTENLDAFPHPCVVYTQNPHALRFGYRAGVNLLGQAVTDVTFLEDDVFPMLKTNRVSVHPTLATIYFNLFYHHGAGSRTYLMRATSVGYYDNILVDCADSEELLTQLQTNPEGFISSLNGDLVPLEEEVSR